MFDALKVINTNQCAVLYGFGSITVKCYVQDDKLICCISDCNRAFLSERRIQYEFHVTTETHIIEKNIYREIDMINLRYGCDRMVVHKQVRDIVDKYNKYSSQMNNPDGAYIAFDSTIIDYDIDWKTYTIKGTVEYKNSATIKFNGIEELKTALENIQKWK